MNNEQQHPLRLANLFSDHAVLQRDMPVPVWGWTRPGARVQVKLGAHEARTLAGRDGKFLTRLPPLPAGGPFALEVSTVESGERVVVRDVMIGEVWVCAGQSNMEWLVKDVAFEPQSLTDRDARIRSLKVPQLAEVGRQTDVAAVWQTATPDAVPGFTAVGFFFARRLARELDVAVGLLNASWGGTRIETWIGREELVRHEWTRSEVLRYEATFASAQYWRRFAPYAPGSPEAVAKILEALYPRDPGNTGYPQGWANADYDDRAWLPVALPGSWGLFVPRTNGVFWFRREVAIPAAWAGQDLTLGIGAVDKHDLTYFNGEPVGATGQFFEEQHWCVPRFYTVPGRLVRAGRAVIAVRAYSFIYDGGMIGPADKMSLAPADGSAPAIPLAGEWRLQNEHDFGLTASPSQPDVCPFGPSNPQSPYMLNDCMIQPLIPYAIRGAAWYQGESNDALAAEYGWMLRALIRDWRRAWGQGDFPFLTVQLANFRPPQAFEPGSTWAVIRERQLRSLQEANTGVAVAIDIGDAVDIHPRNKQDVGERLAQWALAKTYGKALVPSGPLYRDYVVEGERIRLRFDHVGGGLVAKAGALRTFVIASSNRRFVPAQATIEGDTVLVQAPAVAEPVAVRYAWADNPDGCNLYNREGLPASPFRTDAW